METSRRTWFDDRGLTVAPDRRVPYYAGAMHYWRVDPSRWAACLTTMRAQGLTLVETYVPWRVHEPAPGVFAWRGRNDLAKFVAAARAAELDVVLRVGPHFNAELTSFGLPDHVLADPACQARTARGTPAWLPAPPRAFPIPSYASAVFHARVQAWFAEVARIVVPMTAPEGPVVALGVDNEAQLYFRLGAYDLDYHPDAIAWWREVSGLEGEPPRAWDPDDRGRCLSWVRFKDQYLARALAQFASALDAVGLGGVARFHNAPPGHHGLYDVRGLQRALGGPVGLDAYTPRREFRALRRRAHALVGDAAPVPIAFEVGVGFFPWLPPLDPGPAAHATETADRERDQLLTLLAAGVRGFGLYMAVERDRYYGAAISAHGRLEPHARWIAPLLATLTDVDWTALRRATPVAVIASRADARVGLATSTIDPVTPVLAEVLALGAGGAAELGTDPAARASRRWLDAVTAALELARVPFALLDDGASEAELAGYRAVIVPTVHRLDRGLWLRLRALAEHKRTIVVMGPTLPTHDEFDQPIVDDPARRIGKIREGSLDDLPGLAADLAALAGELDPTWLVEAPAEVGSYTYADATGRVRVVFVVSDAPTPTAAVVRSGEARALRDACTGERLPCADGRVTVPLAARGIRMLVPS